MRRKKRKKKNKYLKKIKKFGPWILAVIALFLALKFIPGGFIGDLSDRLIGRSPGKPEVVEKAAPKTKPPAVKPPAVKPPAVKPPAVKPPAVKPPVVVPKPGKALLAIVIDDCGYTKKNFGIFAEISVPITMAVLPDTAFAKDVCSFAKRNGKEIIVHLPLEPVGITSGLEKSTIKTGMDDANIRKLVSSSIKAVPGAAGANNHMGSKATADERVMRIVFEELDERGMFFLDSRTSSDSVCAEIASEEGMRCAGRDIFLDNILDEASVLAQLEKAKAMALKNGSAIAIGHDREVTMKAVKKAVPGMKKSGIEFVFLSDIMKVR